MVRSKRRPGGGMRWGRQGCWGWAWLARGGAEQPETQPRRGLADLLMLAPAEGTGEAG